MVLWHKNSNGYADSAKIQMFEKDYTYESSGTILFYLDNLIHVFTLKVDEYVSSKYKKRFGFSAIVNTYNPGFNSSSNLVGPADPIPCKGFEIKIFLFCIEIIIQFFQNPKYCLVRRKMSARKARQFCKDRLKMDEKEFRIKFCNELKGLYNTDDMNDIVYYNKL